MMTTVDIESLAEQAAGNWQKFDSFCWFEPVENPADVAIVYTSNRDSSTLDRANAEAIAAELAAYVESGDVVAQRHSHWAVGHVDGYAIRVYDDAGAITDAFRCWADLQARLDDYPILDEDILSRIEQEEIDESWDSWIAYDFQRALEKQFDVDLDAGIGITNEQLRELFDNACNKAGEYPQHDGAEVVVNLDKIVEAVTYWAIKPYFPRLIVRIFQDGFPLVDGYSIAGDAVCLTPLYETEFELAMEARDDGHDFVNLNGQILTWEVS